MKKTVSSVYKITCVPTGKFYLGSSANTNSRWISHKYYLNRGEHCNPRLLNAWNKYGDAAFLFEVIETVPDTTILVEREQFYIDTLNPAFNIRKIAHSNKGITFSDEALKNMRLAGQLRRKPKQVKESRTFSFSTSTHCQKGHLLTAENITLVIRKGIKNPICKTCRRESQASWYKQNTVLTNPPRVKNHCHRGHEFTDDNTYWAKRKSNGKMQRKCKACDRIRQKEHYEKTTKYFRAYGVSDKV